MDERVRYVEPHSDNSRYVACRCEFEGCDNLTRKAKPYCSEHVDRHPYVEKLLSDLDAYEAQRTGDKKLKITDILVVDVAMTLLRLGKTSRARLARVSQVPLKKVNEAVDILARRGLVICGKTHKGRRFVEPKRELQERFA